MTELLLPPDRSSPHHLPSEQLAKALLILRWTLGLVILRQSLRFAFSPGAAETFAKTGMPNVVHLALAWSEAVAALLLLIPRTIVIAGRLLIAVLVAAIVIHLLHKWFDVGVLLVYGAAAWTIVAAESVLTA